MIRKTTTLIAILATVLMAPLAVQAQDEELEPYEARTNPNADAHGPVDGLTITGTVEEIRDGQVVLDTTTGIQHIQVLPDTGVPVNLAEGDEVAIDYTRNTQGVMIATEIRFDEARVVETETAVVETETAAVQTGDDLDAVAVVETEADTESGFEREVETEVAEAEAEVDEFQHEVKTETEEFEREVETETHQLEREVETEAAEVETEVESDFESADTGFQTEDDFDTEDDFQTDTATTTTTTSTRTELPSTASGLPLVALLSLLTLGAAIAVRTFRS